MKQYKVIIKLTNGDRVEANVTARNQSDAIKRLQETQQFAEFVEGKTLDGIEVVPVPIQPIDNERFGVTTIDNKPGWYVIADLDNKVKIEWKKGMYNETNRAMPTGDGELPADALKMATILREIGEYLSLNFKELI